MKKKPLILAVCGVKNSGKTILIQKLIPLLQNQGLKVAAVKHDGHDFTPDVPGTDSHRMKAAGAFGKLELWVRQFFLTQNIWLSGKRKCPTSR